MNRMGQLYFRKFRFLGLCALLIAVITLSASPGSHHHLLTMAQEHATQGGSTSCDFAGGLGTGLGIAALFGCVACGVGSLLIAGGAYILC